jgi:sec-independent protein translocase protein TatC
VADAFNLRLQVCFVVGVIATSPIWIYQLLRFIAPGLHRHERRWALISAAVSVPLFLAGVAMAYFALPHVLGAFLGFTPEGAQPIIDVDRYITFLLQISLAFGIGFLAPVAVVALNALGVLSARRFASWWRWVLLGTLVFAAVATPTADPINLMLFASPILALMLVAFGVCWLNDRRRARRRRADGLEGLGDDETSPLTVRRVESDDVPSDLS